MAEAKEKKNQETKASVKAKKSPVVKSEKDPLVALEDERLFGEQVDPFLEMKRCQVMERVFRHAPPQDITEDELWRTVAPSMRRAELQAILDALIPVKKSQKAFLEQVMGSGRYYRAFPDSVWPDGDDVLEALYRTIANRKRIWQMLADAMGIRGAEYRLCLGAPTHRSSAFETRVDELQKCLGLEDSERELMVVLFLKENEELKLGDLDFRTFRGAIDLRKLAVSSGMTESQLSYSLSGKGNLRKYGVIDDDGDLNRAFVNYLQGVGTQALTERFWTRCTEEALPWEFHGKIAENHGAVISDMVRSKPASCGRSILLYGAAGAGKTSFAVSLAAHLGRELYFIAQTERDATRHHYSCSFRYAALAAAQRQLDPEKCILVVDECDDMIEANKVGDFPGRFFLCPDGAITKGQLNAAIDENRHTVLWICNSPQEAIARSSRRRFDYSVLFDELLPETRMRIWENCLKKEQCEGKLSREFVESASRRYKVNAGGIALSVKNAAALVAKDPQKSFEECISTFLQAHCTLLGIRRSREDALEPARDYSLEGLNIHGGIRPERLLQVCRNFLSSRDRLGGGLRDRPRLNLLLHGVPGSGKTEFVKYLSKRLGRKLNVKNASDLLSRYVGGTEELLAAAFAEAEKNDEILFLDEGDSLLAPRDGAQRSWEVSQVNTLLAEMENFNGIFIVSTNLIQRLDPAALRRFTFRLHFDFLDHAGKEVFYRTYFGPLGAPALSPEDLRALHNIERLTPSDFRNVRQQLFYLENEGLSGREIVEALRQEAQSRDSQGCYRGLGEERHGIGFQE